MFKVDALVRGRVIANGQDRRSVRIPQGRCSVEAFQGIIILAWDDRGTQRTAVLAPEAFEDAIEAGALLITDAASSEAGCPSG